MIKEFIGILIGFGGVIFKIIGILILIGVLITIITLFYEAIKDKIMDMNTQEGKKLIIKSIISIIIIILLYGSWTIIGAGEKGVVTTFGKVNEKSLAEGIHLKWPIADTIHKIA